MKYVLIFCSSIIVACVSTSPIHEAESILSENEYALATREEGFVVCKKAILAPCGVRLSECNDKLKYECTTSVIVIDLRDFSFNQ